ncbi:MAG: putative peptidoglycan glycosyltransferase FtsW [Phycisphaerales bacterium]
MRLGHGLILAALALLIIGVVMVNSAGLTVDAITPISLRGVLLGRPAVYAALAVVMLVIGSLVPVDRLFTLRGGLSPIPWIVAGMIALLFAANLPGIGHAENGARRWINLGSLTFQPSEVAKWSLPIVIAWHCARRGDALSRFRTGFLPPLAIATIVCALIAKEDLGTAVLVFGVCIAMLLAAGCRVWHAALLMIPAAAGIVGLILTSPYRVNRILAYLDPYKDAQGIGYHIIQSITAVSGGGVAGRGLGNSIQKFDYLPEDTTDFIFAILCEELGVAGAVVVGALYATIMICGLGIVRRAKTPFSRLLGLGIVLTLGFQAVMNLAVVTGLAPTKGIALPLLSRGGTGWLLTAFAIGLLVSIDRAAGPVAEADDEQADDASESLDRSLVAEPILRRGSEEVPQHVVDRAIPLGAGAQ